MRIAAFRDGGEFGIAIGGKSGPFRGLLASDRRYPGDLDEFIARGQLDSIASALADAPEIDLDALTVLPPIQRPGKIVCIGLNYADHSAESGFKVPDYPAIFARFASGLIGHGAPLIAPSVSEQFDYEGEIAVVIGRGGRRIKVAHALDHIAGYSLFNDGSIRDYQFKTPQWTVGKNFDGTGAFGPWLVMADEVPPGAKGLTLETRLNGVTVQSASSDDLVFDIAHLVSMLSDVFAWEAGDVLVSGTPAGVGLARNPPLWMKPGDVCEIEATGLGVLRNRVLAESPKC